MQRITVWRKSDNQSAFSAYKVDGKEEYNVIHNNLSPQETQRFINFEQKHQDEQKQQLSPPPPNLQSEDEPEIG